jgi:sulfopyruvate decarboxylase TPP-binding subunit
MKFVWQVAFPVSDLIAVIEQEDSESELYVGREEIGVGFENGAAEFGGRLRVVVLFGESGLCEEQVGIVGVSESGLLEELFVVEGT